MKNNPAYDRILRDYVNFHVVWLFVGGLITLVVLLLCLFAWRRFRRVPEWSFEKRTYLVFGIVSLVFGLFLLVAFAANLSVVLNPGPGLVDAIGPAGTGLSKAWLQSGSAHVPPLIQHRVDQRLAWQRPKAIICGVLLIVFAALSVRLWRPLLRPSGPNRRRGLLLGSAIVSVMASVLLSLMVIGNAEGSIAPLTLTLIYG
jgi:hypothetical protein